MHFTRISKEISELKFDPPENCVIGLTDESDIYNWTAVILGPDDSPYENGVFLLEIILPETYPFKPPELKFKTQIFHPNINPDESFCTNEMKDWSPSYKLSNILKSIIELLTLPIELLALPNTINANQLARLQAFTNTRELYGLSVASIYKYDRRIFDQIAKEWTRLYAI